MQSFWEFLQVAVTCGAWMVMGFLVLLALPQSKLRSVLLEVAQWLVVLACGLLIVSPIDFVPDVFPLIGWLDDLGYLSAGAVATLSAIYEHFRRPRLKS